MYRFGIPTHRTSARKEAAVILLVLLLIGGGVYWFFGRGKTEVKNNPTPLTSEIKAPVENTTNIDEPSFSMRLPGVWKESARDFDSTYHVIQWADQDKNSSGRWVRVYIDTIPSEYAINYLVPVTRNGNSLSVGQMSDNCTTYTADTQSDNSRDVSVPISEASKLARWQGVSFLCDNTHVSHRVVGIGSTEGINFVRLDGATSGSHKFFILYNDSTFRADYAKFTSILNSFTSK